MKGKSWTKKDIVNCKKEHPKGDALKICGSRNMKRKFCKKCNENVCNSNTNSNKLLKKRCQRATAHPATKYMNKHKLDLNLAKYRCGICMTEKCSECKKLEKKTFKKDSDKTQQTFYGCSTLCDHADFEEQKEECAECGVCKGREPKCGTLSCGFGYQENKCDV